ncbi:HU family DNA-binding protein [Planctomycetota bacterium]
MPNITKKELIDRVTKITQSKNVTVKVVVQQFLDEVISELANNNRLEFRNFGVFEARRQSARVAQNPKTLEPIEVPAKRRVKFKMGRGMQASLNRHGQ